MAKRTVPRAFKGSAGRDPAIGEARLLRLTQLLLLSALELSDPAGYPPATPAYAQAPQGGDETVGPQTANAAPASGGAKWVDLARNLAAVPRHLAVLPFHERARGEIQGMFPQPEKALEAAGLAE